MIQSRIYIWALSLILSSCGWYSFTGAEVTGDTINIAYIENESALAPPYLSPTLTQSLKEKVQDLTRLQLSDLDSTDIRITGTVRKYMVDVAALNQVDQASTNRLKIAVEINYENKLQPEDNFTRSFERFAEFGSEVTLQEVENQKIDEIVELLVNDIFNATFANW